MDEHTTTSGRSRLRERGARTGIGPARLAAYGALGAACAAVLAAVSVPVPPTAGQGWKPIAVEPAGDPVNDLGQDLAVSQAVLATPGMAPIRRARGCRWAAPGSNPWRGDSRTALVVAGIPQPYADQIVEQIRAGRPVGTVTFTAQAITSDTGLMFAHRFSMTFANTICEDSRVAFGADRAERGGLYSAGGYFVAVPDVCGNVTRLFLASDAPRESAGDAAVPPGVDSAPEAAAPGASVVRKGHPASSGVPQTTGPAMAGLAPVPMDALQAGLPFAPTAKRESLLPDPLWGEVPLQLTPVPPPVLPSLPPAGPSDVPTVPTVPTVPPEVLVPTVPPEVLVPPTPPMPPGVPVPAPATLGCVVAGLVALVASGRRRRG